MFCLLPPTRLALGNLPDAKVPDASGLFNLMRNLGGAIGIAAIDTVIYGRGPVHSAEIIARLQAGDAATAAAIGLPPSAFAMRGSGPLDAQALSLIQPFVEKASLTHAMNEAWGMVAIVTLLALAIVPFAKASKPEEARSPSV